MMKRCVVFLTAAVFIFSAGFVFAEQIKEKKDIPGMQHPAMKMSDEDRAKKDEERINARIEELTKRLDLTPQQQAQIKAVMTNTSGEVRKVMKEAWEKARVLVKEDHEKIKALLTKEQKEKMQEGKQGPGPGQKKPEPETEKK